MIYIRTGDGFDPCDEDFSLRSEASERKRNEIAALLWAAWREARFADEYGDVGWASLQKMNDDQSRAYVMAFEMMAGTILAKAVNNYLAMNANS